MGQWIRKADRRDCVGKFHVVADPVIQGKVVTNLPGVLREESNRTVLDRAIGITKALNKC